MMNNKKHTLSYLDPEIYKIIKNENNRQEDNIELIASENYTSKSVMEAQGSQLTNKYAEGYPGKRYYGGCHYVDYIEELAISRLKKVFIGAEYANVQPHSGSQANAAVYLALLKPGDTILGMSLKHGGHLTHGAKINFSGFIYNSIQYGLDSTTHDINYNEIEYLAKKHKPKMIIAGFSAFSGIVNWKYFREISDKVGAYLMVDIAHIAGLIAAGLYPNPIEYADIITSTTHKTLRGPRGGIIFSKANPDIEKKLQSMVFPGMQGGPLMHVIAAKAVAFKEIMTPQFKEYQIQVLKNAKIMAKTIMNNGINVISRGTSNHLILIDLLNHNISGKDLEEALGKANITVNKNSIPNDPRSPFITSGIRIGTPAITTRGFMEKESVKIASWICDIIKNINNVKIQQLIKKKVIQLCSKFPIYKVR